MRSHRYIQTLSASFVVLTALCTLHAAVSAAQAPPLLWQAPEDGKAGEDAGQLGGGGGIATDPTTGHVYVTDELNDRISEFNSWGGFVKAFGWGVADGASEELQTCAAVCFKGLEGDGPGQFNDPDAIAVGPDGDVYVFDRRNHRVQRFDPAGSNGSEAEFLWMAGGNVNKTRVEEPGSTEAARNLCTAASGDLCQAGTAGTGIGEFEIHFETDGDYIDFAPSGELYVADLGGEGGMRGRVQAFATNGEFKSQILLPESDYEGQGSNVPTDLAVDPNSGSIYFAFSQVRFLEKSPQPNVYKLSPSGSVLDELEVETPLAISVDVNGNVYVLEGPRTQRPKSEVFKFDPSGNLVMVFARVDNPTVHRTLATNVIGPGSDIPGHVYVGSAGSPDGLGFGAAYITAYGPVPEFEPPPKVAPEIYDQYASSVDPEGALLKGKINPHFWKDTTYYVEYGTEECSEEGCTFTHPTPPGSTLTSQLVRAPLAASVPLAGLEPGTTYHYRFVAQSSGSAGQPVRGLGGEPGLDGSEATFTTPPLPKGPPSPDPCPNAEFRVGASALLPDCRAYEMVSPVDKGNGDVLALGAGSLFRARLNQGAASGGALTFSSFRAFAGAASGSWSSQYLADRRDSGWSTEAISPPKSGSALLGGNEFITLDTPFRAFSGELESAWVVHQFEPALDPDVPGGFANIVQRDSADGTYEGLMRAVPPHNGTLGTGSVPDLQGISADGSHSFFRIADKLTFDAAEPVGSSPPDQLYESYSENGGPRQVHLVSVLPNDVPATTGASVGISEGDKLFGAATGRLANVSDAISEDGSRIYWTASGVGPGKLYVRIDGSKTLAVSESISSLPARFWAASADGSKALYAFTSGSREGDLYEFNLETAKSKLVAHDAIGLLDASENLSRFYFVSEEALAEGAVGGQPNLYLREAGTFTFLTRLSVGDVETTPGQPTPASHWPFWHAARASADGLALAFMSSSKDLGEAVAGYDNTDQATGKPVTEVYRYDAEAARLSCVSCNPTGARPVGRVDVNLVGLFAAKVPGFEMQLHQPRYLSESGSRLFFESFEALLPRDTNDKGDVYQWEAPGSGDCTEASPAFSVPNDGCLSLISSGESPRDSEFIDADASGNNVFFSTLSSFAPQDTGLVDIYVARAGGGLPPPPSPPARCEGEACQGPAPDRADPTPASSSYAGAGNVSDKPRPRCRKGKVRRRGRCVKRNPKAPNRKAQREANRERRAKR